MFDTCGRLPPLVYLQKLKVLPMLMTRDTRPCCHAAAMRARSVTPFSFDATPTRFSSAAPAAARRVRKKRHAAICYVDTPLLFQSVTCAILYFSGDDYSRCRLERRCRGRHMACAVRQYARYELCYAQQRLARQHYDDAAPFIFRCRLSPSPSISAALLSAFSRKALRGWYGTPGRRMIR